LKYSPEKDEAIIGSKSGATLNYGPFQNVGPTVGVTFQNAEQQVLSIHYEYDKPILSVVKYERAAEISHWGANLNIEDKVMLRNDGPKYVYQLLRLIHPI
jgi:oligosaccharyltransferase complex subunit alpha (ribophorin I)